ncbi:MAG: hypothetical protein HC907_11635 [Richelia sp. SM1_7_0]|nr:hypothetical protein [Richelia sp. SM1_7_0]
MAERLVEKPRPGRMLRLPIFLSYAQCGAEVRLGRTAYAPTRVFPLLLLTSFPQYLYDASSSKQLLTRKLSNFTYQI